MQELKKVKDKAEKVEKVGEYYSSLENCEKEIEACDIAVKALEKQMPKKPVQGKPYNWIDTVRDRGRYVNVKKQSYQRACPCHDDNRGLLCEFDDCKCYGCLHGLQVAYGDDCFKLLEDDDE